MHFISVLSFTVTEYSLVSSPVDVSLPWGSATLHSIAPSDPSVCPCHEWGGVSRGGPALAVFGRCLEHPQVGRQAVLIKGTWSKDYTCLFSLIFICFMTSTQWPEDDEDLLEYRLEFFDGWQPPEVKEERESKPSATPVRKQMIPSTPALVEHEVSVHITHRLFILDGCNEKKLICFLSVDVSQVDTSASCCGSAVWTGQRYNMAQYERFKSSCLCCFSAQRRKHWVMFMLCMTSLQEITESSPSQKVKWWRWVFLFFLRFSTIPAGSSSVLKDQNFVHSCWTTPNCGGEWGTAEERTASYPAISWRRTKNLRRWPSSFSKL